MSQVFEQFVVMKPDQMLDELKVSPDIYQQLDERYDQFRSHTLVSGFRFTGDWPTWEKHPAGDEMVVLLSGEATFLLRRESGDESIALKEPGEFVIVPRDTWHTARIDQPTTMLFITPGAGTRNEESPVPGT